MSDTRDIRRVGADEKSRVLEELRAAIGEGPHRSDAHALVVGIDRYVDASVPTLRYARADAEAMHAALVDPEIGRFDPAQATLLVDEQATRAAILRALGDIARRAGVVDTVIVYFAGHGAPEIDTRGDAAGDGIQKFLVTYDADASDLYATAIPMEEVERTFGRIRARSLVFLLDACYSGTAGGRTFRSPAVSTRAVNLSGEFLEQIAKGEGRCVMTSCDVNEVSVESNDFGHGLFTHYLLEGMRGKADTDGSGAVAVDELFRYVSRNVRDASGRCGAKMQPVLTGQMRGSVVLTLPETPALKRARELRAEAAAARALGDVDAAERMWREAASLDPADATAREALAAIEAERTAARELARRAEEEAERVRAEEARRRAAEHARRARVLRDHFESGAMGEGLFAYAIEVLDADASTLAGVDRSLRRLVDGLTDREMPVERFVKAARALGTDPALRITPPPSAAEAAGAPAARVPRAPDASAPSDLPAVAAPLITPSTPPVQAPVQSPHTEPRDQLDARDQRDQRPDAARPRGEQQILALGALSAIVSGLALIDLVNSTTVMRASIVWTAIPIALAAAAVVIWRLAQHAPQPGWPHARSWAAVAAVGSAFALYGMYMDDLRFTMPYDTLMDIWWRAALALLGLFAGLSLLVVIAVRRRWRARAQTR